jgi:hypothetical protein
VGWNSGLPFDASRVRGVVADKVGVSRCHEGTCIRSLTALLLCAGTRFPLQCPTYPSHQDHGRWFITVLGSYTSRSMPPRRSPGLSRLTARHHGLSTFASGYATETPSKSTIDQAAELIDKCVGSRIWVIMKGDKGKPMLDPRRPLLLTPGQSSAEPFWASTTTSVSWVLSRVSWVLAHINADMVLEDVIELSVSPQCSCGYR